MYTFLYITVLFLSHQSSQTPEFQRCARLTFKNTFDFTRKETEVQRTG